MPSSPGYKRDYKQEVKTQKKRDATKADPKGTRKRIATGKARAAAKKAGKPVKGKDMTHVGKPAKSGGKKIAVGARSSNRKHGGRIGNRAGKAAGGRKSKG